MIYKTITVSHSTTPIHRPISIMFYLHLSHHRCVCMCVWLWTSVRVCFLRIMFDIRTYTTYHIFLLGTCHKAFSDYKYLSKRQKLQLKRNQKQIQNKNQKKKQATRTKVVSCMLFKRSAFKKWKINCKFQLGVFFVSISIRIYIYIYIYNGI